MQTLTASSSQLKAVLVAAVVWAVVMGVFGLAGGGLDPLEHETALLWLVVFAGFAAALAGTVVGARVGRTSAWAPALTVVVLGALLTASGGGTTATDHDVLLYAAFPVGALLGALVAGAR